MERNLFKHIMIIFLVVTVVFINTVLMDFAWDDLQQIVYNPLLDDIRFTFFRLFKENLNYNMPVYFRPVFTYSLAFDTLLWGKQNPYGYHLTNVLLNTAVALLSYLTLKKCEMPENVAFIATLIFASHPAHCEVVANISARNELLSALFMLTSFLVYFSDWRLTVLKKILSAMLFFVAILSKENAVLFPLLIIAYERLYKKKPFGSLAKNIFPFFVVICIYFLLRKLYLPLVFGFKDPLKVRLFTAVLAFLHHIKITFLPFNLKVFYEIVPIKSLDFHSIAKFLLAVVGMIMVIYFKRDKRIIFFLFWFFVILLPASNLLVIIRPSPIADRYSYLPSLGLIAIFVFTSASLFFDKNSKLNIAGKVFYTFVIVFLAISSMQRNWNWKDYPTFAKKMVEDAPNSAFAYNNLGISLSLAKDYAGAEEAFKKTLEIMPGHDGALYGLGRVYFDQKRFKDAQKYFELVVASKPNFFDALYYLGETYRNLNMLKEAENTFFSLIKINPSYDLAYNSLADIYISQGDYKSAVVFLKKALMFAPWVEEYKVKLERLTRLL